MTIFCYGDSNSCDHDPLAYPGDRDPDGQVMWLQKISIQCLLLTRAMDS